MTWFMWLLAMTGSLHGFVQEQDSGEPIPFATVLVLETGSRYQADDNGYYVISGMAPGPLTLVVEGLGFRPDTASVIVPAAENRRVDFQLQRRPLALPAVTGAAVSSTPAGSGTAAGPQPMRLTAQDLTRAPALAEPDVLRSVQTLPAFAAASDFSTALYVRGSPPDQTMVALDGAPMFNPYHLGGLFAAIDPSAVAAVVARPGALPASSADRLAGTVNIVTRDGGRDRVRSHGAVGFVSSRASIDGPFPGAGGSYLVSVRRTYLDVITGAAQSIGAIRESLPYGFTDAHLKLTHDIGSTGRASLSAYVNREGLRDPAPDGNSSEWGWGSSTASLSYRQPLGHGVIFGFTSAVSSFSATLYGWDTRPPGLRPDEIAPDGRLPVAESEMITASVGADVALHRRLFTGRFGYHAESFRADHRVEPGWTAVREVLPELVARGEFKSLAGYMQGDFALSRSLTAGGGLRLLRMEGGQTQVLPRVGASYRATPRVTLTLGSGRYAQPVRSLRNEESWLASLFAYDMQTSVPPDTPLPSAEDLVLGGEWAAGRGRLRLEAYGKRLRDIALAPIQADPENAPVLVIDELGAARGRVLGLEILASGANERYDVTLSWAITAARYTLGGVTYTPRYERRNLLDLSTSRLWQDSGRLTARLAVGSGQPTSTLIGALVPHRYDPATGSLVPGPGSVRLYSKHNDGRMPPYVRLDIGVRKTYERQWFGRRADVTPYAQVLNVLNTANPLWTEVDVEGGIRQTRGPRLPILPTFGFEWSF